MTAAKKSCTEKINTPRAVLARLDGGEGSTEGTSPEKRQEGAGKEAAVESWMGEESDV